MEFKVNILHLEQSKVIKFLIRQAGRLLIININPYVHTKILIGQLYNYC